MKLKRGSTSVRRLIFIADSSSTTGAGLANLVYNSSGLVAYYFAGDLNNEVQITLATATLGTFASGGFIAVDNTNMPGWYEIGIPDAALDAGNEVAIQLRGATNMVPVNIYIELDAVDYQTDAFGALKPTVAGRTLDVSTTGEAGIDLANVGSPTTSLNLANTTISTSQTITSVSGAVGSVTGNVNGSVASVVAGVTVTTNNDKTGYSLTAGTGLGNQTANITGNLSGSVGSVTNAITVGTINANAITAASLATDAVGEIADGVWDEATSGHTTAGTYGGRIVRATSSNVEVQITGSNHIAADVHEFQTGVIEATDFAAGAITSTVIAADAITSSQLAASAVTEIQSGLATATQLTTVEGKIDTIDNYVDTEVAAIKATTDKLDTTVELDGAVYRFTTNALEQAPSGGGGGSTDWTANERTAIRTILGIPGAGTTPADPVDGVLYDIKQKTDQIGSVGAITSLLAGAVLEPGTITSFPEIITIGDSYTVQNGRSINIPIVDTDGNPISTTGSLNFADATAYFTISRANETDPARIITGTATFVDPPGTGTSAAETPYARIELSSSETSKGLLKYKYSGVLTFVWPGTGTETMSFETETITFDN